MGRRKKTAKRSKPKTILRLPDLEQSKNAVLNSLPARSQVSYGHAIDEFICWYCSEPRLAFNRSVVLRYRFFLEQNNLAPAIINVRLAAVRRLAYEAADTGLLSPELAAGIRRVKGAKRLGVRIGNWLTIDQSKALLQMSSMETARGKRDRAILSLLIGCGLRRAELVGLRIDDLQIREEHWVIADLIGKGRHIRTVPVPVWAKRAVDGWTEAAGITTGRIFRRVSRFGKIWGEGITPKAIWHVVKAAAQRAGIQNLAPHDLRRTCARLCHRSGGELEQIQFLLETVGAAAMPLTVFVTAYDQHAIRAFEANALDYLLKPFSDERWEAALARAKTRHAELGLREFGRDVLRMLATRSQAGRYLDRLVVKGSGTTGISVTRKIESNPNFDQLFTANCTALTRLVCRVVGDIGWAKELSAEGFLEGALQSTGVRPQLGGSVISYGHPSCIRKP